MSNLNGSSNGVVKATEKTNGKPNPDLSKHSVGVEGVKMETEGVQKEPAQPEKVESKPLSIAERLKKVDVLNKLIERREKLTEAQDNVNDFALNSTSSPEIFIQDGAGHSFKIKNSLVVGDILELAKKRLASEIALMDEQIVF